MFSGTVLQMSASKKDKDCKPSVQSCDLCPTRQDSWLCSHAEAVALIDKARVTCHYLKDQTIFRAGSTPMGLFSLQSGLVKLEINSENGAAHTLRIHGPGDVLGYRSLLANENYHASAVALEDVTACYVPKTEILKIFSQYPEVAMRLMEHLSKDLRMAEEKWVDQMDKGATSRVAEAVLFLNDHFDHEHWTRREIAQWAGTTPETVMRTLSQFEKDGLIDQSQRHIKILDRPSLEEKSKEKLR